MALKVWKWRFLSIYDVSSVARRVKALDCKQETWVVLLSGSGVFTTTHGSCGHPELRSWKWTRCTWRSDKSVSRSEPARHVDTQYNAMPKRNGIYLLRDRQSTFLECIYIDRKRMRNGCFLQMGFRKLNLLFKLKSGKDQRKLWFSTSHNIFERISMRKKDALHLHLLSLWTLALSDRQWTFEEIASKQVLRQH